MMGSGKSTVGRLLAERVGAVFIDLDVRIERLFGRTIGELFEAGEPYFRACERQALASLVQEPAFAAQHVVVATGGGIVLDPANRQTMAAHGTVVHLDVPLDELIARLEAPDARAVRPLAAGSTEGLRERLSVLWTARRPSYRTAQHCLDGRGTPLEVVARLQRELYGDPEPKAV